jgi:DNA repair protein RadA/Sms
MNPARIRRCQHCGARMPAGDFMKCLACKRWNSTEDANEVDDSSLLSEEDDKPFRRIITGVDVVDEMWGGPDGKGVVSTAVSLIGGGPGAGKSTLSLQLARAFGDHAFRTTDRQLTGVLRPVMYIASEETKPEIRERAKRLDTSLDIVRVVPMNAQGSLRFMILKHRPCAIFVDSLAGLTANPELAVETSKRFKEYSEELDAPVFLVTHATKSADIAGLLALQHAPDVCMTLFAPYQGSEIREMTSLKSRYGPSNYCRHLLMTEKGLIRSRLDDDDDEDDEVVCEGAPKNKGPGKGPYDK